MLLVLIPKFGWVQERVIVLRSPSTTRIDPHVIVGCSRGHHGEHDKGNIRTKTERAVKN